MPDLELRAVAFQLRSDASDGDGLTLEGYAAVFDSPTFISDRLGEYEETIAPGAFKRSVNARKPVLQFDHGQHPVLGSVPIGAIEALAEDSRGLFVRARLFDNWMTQPVRDAITAGAIDGMSFRFETIRDARENWESLDGDRKRTLQEVRLHELGPVVFPAYQDTSVALRSLAAHVPGVTLTLNEDTPQPSTSEEPAAESRSTSDEPATGDPDPTPPSHSEPPDHSYAARQKLRRELQMSRLGIERK
jgi:HK97 family phage prohead protease